MNLQTDLGMRHVYFNTAVSMPAPCVFISNLQLMSCFVSCTEMACLMQWEVEEKPAFVNGCLEQAQSGILDYSN